MAHFIYSECALSNHYKRTTTIDTVTQLALGAAVGEALLGRRAAHRAALWGAAAGLTPDLDVLLGAFTSETVQLGIHRGLSHSLLFAVAGGLLGGKLTAALHSQLDVRWRDWATLWFLGLLTHALLDSFTMYGTQLFNPFSTYPVAFSTIFIIDPLYTFPLLFLLLAALRHPPDAQRRRRLNGLGLAISSCYLLLTAANSLHVRATFADALNSRNIPYQRLFAAPTPLNNLLWMGIAESDDALYVGLYSLFDDRPPDRFRRIEKNTALVAPYWQQRPLRALRWFSRGYYHAHREGDDLFFNDLRFGRSDIWLDADGDYIFSFRLLRDAHDADLIVDFAQRSPTFAAHSALLKRFARRIGGDVSVVEYAIREH